MKKPFVALTLLFVALNFGFSQAKADTIFNTKDNFIDIGLITAGMSGKINTATTDLTTNGTAQERYDYASIELAPNTTITLTYKTGNNIKDEIDSPVFLNYRVDSSGNQIGSSTSSLQSNISSFTTGNSENTILTLVVTNVSDAAAYFSAYLLGTNYSNPHQVNTFFSTVAAVPLPAALPLFASGIAGLAWKRRRAQKSKSAA